MIQAGLVILFVGGLLLAIAIPEATDKLDFAPGLLLGGIGIGLIAGQLPNMILSGVDGDEASEASGLQGTAQNLGMALGTAVIGSVILSVGLSSIAAEIDDSTIITAEAEADIQEAIEAKFTEPAVSTLEDELAQQPQEVQDEARRIFEDGTLRGFQGAILAGGLVALFGALMATRLPRRKLESDSDAEGGTVAQATRNTTTMPGVQLEMNDLSPPTG